MCKNVWEALIYTQHKPGLWDRKSISGSGSSSKQPKLLGLRLHSTGCNTWGADYHVRCTSALSLSLSALPQLSTTSQPGAQRSYKKSRRKPEQIYSMQVNNDSLKSTPIELLPIAYGIEPTERRRDKSIPRLHERASKTPSHIDPSPSPSYNTQQPRPTTAHEIPFHSVYTITNKKLSKPHQKYGPQPRGAFTGIKPVPICTTTVYSCQPSSRTHLSAIPPYQSRFYTVASDLVVVLIHIQHIMHHIGLSIFITWKLSLRRTADSCLWTCLIKCRNERKHGNCWRGVWKLAS